MTHRDQRPIVVSDLKVDGDTDQVVASLTAKTPASISRRVEELCREAQGQIRIRAVYRACDVQHAEGERVIVGGVSFRSCMLAEQLTDARHAFPFVLTCGSDVDSLSAKAADPFESYCIEAIAHVQLRDACQALLHRIQTTHDTLALASMYPGAGRPDLWPIEQQGPLFALLGDVEAAIGVRLTDNYMMIPMKTISGIAHPSASGFVSCQHCNREDCESRSGSAQSWFGT